MSHSSTDSNNSSEKDGDPNSSSKPVGKMDSKRFSLQLKSFARKLGFSLVGITPAVSPPGYPRLVDWLNNQYDAGMSYLKRRLHAYQDPDFVMSEVSSIIMLGMSYLSKTTRFEPEANSSENFPICLE